ncbi:MAG: SH3 domain-containing protein [Oscillospiraceae bacterium]|nr:SH3 domain-containing protein [Oscillospiraceae bacterium]
MEKSKIILELAQPDEKLLNAAAELASSYDIEFESVVNVESDEDGEAGISDEEKSLRTNATVSTGGGYLNMRLSRSTASTSVAQIPNGTSINVVKADNAWLTLTYSNTVGFVQSQYVSGYTLTYYGEGMNKSTAKVNSDGVNVRSGPSTSNPAVGTKNRGNIVTIYSRSALDGQYYWYKISSSDQWIRGDYLAPYQ